MDFRVIRAGYKRAEEVNVDVLKDKYIGRLIAVALDGEEPSFGRCLNYRYKALINLGGGDSPHGETEGGIWAISFGGHAFWIRHNTPVYLLNARGDSDEI